jgi:maleylacetoacetate isomerase
MSLKLYTWWRSQASYRVRIALHLKKLEADMIFVDLSNEEQFSPKYRLINPAMVLPTLIDGEGPPLQDSLAIIDYLEERCPEPPLLPSEPRARAHVRALSHVLAVDAHPLIVPRVRKYLERELGVDERGRMRWLQHWLNTGLETFERLVASHPRAGPFCYGTAATVADICLVAHVTSAQMLYGLDLQAYPIVEPIFQTCMRLDAFMQAHPERQPDAPA